MGTRELTGFPHPVVEAGVTDAARRFAENLAARAPAMAKPVTDWLETVYGGRGIGGAFLDPTSYPVVHLPAWAVPSIDDRLAKDIAYSSIAGYAFIRLIDDVMDQDGIGEETGLLPSLAFFQLEFTNPYAKHFSAGHPFWDALNDAWTEAAQAALMDHRLENRDLASFRNITARKTRAAFIPLAAALHQAGGEASLPEWSSFIDAFSRWHQFQNDLFDWRQDLEHGNYTLLLTEGLRAGDGRRTIDTWFWQSGLEWAAAVLGEFELEVRQAAEELRISPLEEYIGWRFDHMSGRLDEIRNGVKEMQKLADLLDRRI